jgi:hypothetical protein
MKNNLLGLLVLSATAYPFGIAFLEEQVRGLPQIIAFLFVVAGFLAALYIFIEMPFRKKSYKESH